jgi:tripartite-type tricarboxylate transporter receptor subunit TctC
MRNLKKQLRLLISFLCLTITNAVLCQTDPITLVVGSLAGSNLDFQARKLATAMQSQGGRAVRVVNKPGQWGGVAADFITNASPDGSTLFINDSYPQNEKSAALEPLVYIGEKALGIWARPNARPVSAKFAFSGSPSNLAFMHSNKQILGQWLGVEITLVPYRGITPAVSDTSAGRTDYLLGELGINAGAIEAGLVLIATSSPKVSKGLGLASKTIEIPQLQEFAIPLGIFVPYGTHTDVKSFLRKSIRSATASELFRQAMQATAVFQTMSPPEMLTLHLNNFAKMAKRAIEDRADIPDAFVTSTPSDQK